MRLKEFTSDTVANWKTIADLNDLQNPDMIRPGQVLDVGDGIVLPRGTTYVVKPGDTLSGIARTIQRTGSPSGTGSSNVTAAPVIKSTPPEIKRGRPTMAADRDQTPPSVKPTSPDYHDPAYDVPPDTAPVDDDAIKKSIGADQPIPSYKFDPGKDQAILDRLKKQDQERQKKLQQQDQEIKKNFPEKYKKKYAPATGK